MTALDVYVEFAGLTGPMYLHQQMLRSRQRAGVIVPDEFRAPLPSEQRWKCSYCDAQVEARRGKCNNCGAARML